MHVLSIQLVEFCGLVNQVDMWEGALPVLFATQAFKRHRWWKGSTSSSSAPLFFCFGTILGGYRKQRFCAGLDSAALLA